MSSMMIGERRVQLVTKSGGFGAEDALVKVVEAAAAGSLEGASMKDVTDPDEKAQPAPTARVRSRGLPTGSTISLQRIPNGDYPVNQKLPSEKALAESSGVAPRSAGGAGAAARAGADPLPAGRRQLRARGADRAPRVRPGGDHRRHPAVLRVGLIETCAARMAAGRRNEEALAEIGTALSLMDAATDSLNHREDADFAFHWRSRRRRTTSTSRRRCGPCASTSTSA